MPSLWNRAWSRPLAAVLASALVLAGALVAPAASAEETGAGEIAGHVTDSAGQPLENVFVVVTAVDVPGREGSSTSTGTDADGEFSMTDLAPGGYKVRFETGGAAQDVVGEWWDDADSEAAASVVSVEDGQTALVDAALAAAGSISGTVTDAAGQPVADVQVIAYRYDAADGRWLWGQFTATGVDGTYALPRLSAGTYALSFGSGDDREIVPEYWQDAQRREDSTTFELGEGQHVTAVDAQVALAGRISGTVTDEAGQPLSNVTVIAHVEEVAGLPDYQSFGVATDVDGTFRLGALPAGEYSIEFGAEMADENVVGEWWDDAISRDEARTVSVTTDVPVVGVDARLGRGGAISGAVVDADGAPIANANVTIRRDGEYVRSFPTLADGRFDVAHLREGPYTVEISAWTPEGLLWEWWDNATSAAEATVVDVVPGEVADPLDVILAESDGSNLETYSAALSGKVTDENGQPIAGAQVDILAADGMSGDGTMTNEAGEWSFERMAAGRYVVSFTANIAGEVVTRFWNDAPDFESATVIDLTRGKRISDVSVALRPPAPPVLPSSAPVIEGTPAVGQSLTVSTGTWTDGVSLVYQWNVGGAPVAGANAAQFPLTAAHRGKAISVTVTGSKQGYQTVSRTSAPTAAVAAGSLSAPVPSVTGTAAVGSTITAATGTWTPGAALTYQWLANGTAIAGATASKLTLTSSVADKAISVRVKGTLAGYTDALRTSAATPKVATVATPTIAGSATTGVKLTATPNSWTTGMTFTYQWNADGAAISGATTSTFTPGTAQDGKAITVSVKGSRSGWATVTKTSKATLKVMRAVTPKVTGTLAYGSRVAVDRGVWSSGTSFRYQWYSDGAAIAGATASSLELTSALKGKRISVKVTGSASGYTTVAKTSAQSVRVATTAKPSVSGTRSVGSTLTATPGTWTSGTTFAYQWYANGTAIAGATSATYVVTSGKESTRITVTVTGARAGYATVSQTSPATSLIMRAGAASMSGTTQVTRQLTASPGTWTTGAVLSYQWYANGVAIGGATARTFTLTSAQAGKSIVVKVTGRLSGYSTITKASKASAKVSYPDVAAPANSWDCPSWAPIKGNANSGIYHLPGQRFYNATKPEQCFRTEAAAVAAGYRKSKV